MDAAAESRPTSHFGLRSLLTDLVTDDDTQAYLLGRAMQFGADTQVVSR